MNNMNLEELAEIKEMMIAYQKQGDKEKFRQYYEQFVKGYKELTVKDFEEELKKQNNSSQEVEM